MNDRSHLEIRWLLGVLLLVLPVAGCVTKAKAKAQAREAFVAGQQQAMRLQQARPATASVTVQGPVANNLVPWTPDLTLAKALVSAVYTGERDPSEIFIVRNGVALRIDPSKLLTGEDFPLQPGDIIDVKP